MNNTKRKPLRSIFLRAAEKEHIAMQLYVDLFNLWELTNTEKISHFACINIRHALSEAGIEQVIHLEEYEEYFARYFKPDKIEETSAWWPKLANDERDYESRILALLLCAEMLRR